MQAILDGAAMGASQRAERENPDIIENDQQLEARGVSHHWVSPGGNAHHQLGSSSEGRP